MRSIILLLLICLSNTGWAQTQVFQTPSGDLTITPLTHASMIWEWDEHTVYIDPSGEADIFKPFNIPDLVVITDIHKDHMDIELLSSLNLKEATLIAPMAVAVQLKELGFAKIEVVNNNEEIDIFRMHIKAIPMYNLPKSKDSFHVKGRGNGYIFNIENQRIYISGDTEDIQEMRDLRNIDIAFVCMNLPYTMTIQQAASAVLEFKPKKVYPYHYRGAEGVFSDINSFEEMVNDKNPNIEVISLNWYP